jgi:GNAT superfamily N-acetyltransferase
MTKELMVMGWYNKLNDYFPDDEMKKKEQMEALVRKNPHYKKEETEQYLTLYAEYDDFIFVDYVLVNKNSRGQGIGSKVLDKLKAKGKNIILEVEPVTEDDPYTARRKQFYVSNGFRKAENIEYRRDVGEDKPRYNKMELYYWTPDDETDEQTVGEQMAQAYEDIHLYEFNKYHDREMPDPDDLIRLDESAGDSNE